MKSLRIVYRAIRRFGEDGAAQMGAAFAYYALFSTAPLLILAVIIAGSVYGEEAARAQVRDRLTELIGAQGAQTVTRLMDRSMHPAQGQLAAVLGSVALVVGALGAFLHLRRCLCIIWRLETPKNGFIVTLLNYTLAIIMVLGMGLLLLASLAISTALPAVAEYLGDDIPGGASFWRWVDTGVSFAFVAIFFVMVFRVMSARRIAWRHVTYGAIVSALLFTVGKTLISFYLAYSSTTSAYGAAGSLVVFMIWIYYSSQISFLGAELVQARRELSQSEQLSATGGQIAPNA